MMEIFFSCHVHSSLPFWASWHLKRSSKFIHCLLFNLKWCVSWKTTCFNTACKVYIGMPSCFFDERTHLLSQDWLTWGGSQRSMSPVTLILYPLFFKNHFIYYWFASLMLLNDSEVILGKILTMHLLCTYFPW